MKKNLLFVFTLFNFFSGSPKIFASHIAGADLTYDCLGGNSYRFNFTLYRDCSGIPVSASYTLLGSSTCGDSIFITLNLDSYSEVAHTCSTVVTKCTDMNSNYQGFQANYYHANVTLPGACNFWTFGLNPALCNRNVAINTLNPNGGAYCFYVETTLDNSTAPCNNSPRFTNLPIQFVCSNQVQYYSTSAYDLDGDSLTYKMISPHNDPDSDVVYIPGLSGTQPVTYNFPDSTRFDTLSGLATFNAAGPQITVMAIEVSEFRNGVLIGTVERDIELIFETCPNNLPTATGINGTPSHIAHVCADSALSFFIGSDDLDPANQTHLTWDNGIPGAFFFTTASFRDTGYFIWTPGTQFISTLPYTFTVTVTDDACPVYGVNSYSFLVYVDSCLTNSVSGIATSVRNFSATYLSSSQSIVYRYVLDSPDQGMVSLYDAVGRKIESVLVEQSARAEGELDVNKLTRGVYLLNLKTAKGESKTIKVIID
jgi:hypothetical protein